MHHLKQSADTTFMFKAKLLQIRLLETRKIIPAVIFRSLTSKVYVSGLWRWDKQSLHILYRSVYIYNPSFNVLEVEFYVNVDECAICLH